MKNIWYNWGVVAVAQLVDPPAGRQGVALKKKYFVYIIYSLKDYRCYTGLTQDLHRRLTEHDRGTHGTPSTISRGPFRLIHAEQCISLAEA